MSEHDFGPYESHEDALEEYRSLRTEILESNKQRITLFQISLVFIMAIFGYWFKDNSDLKSIEALFLIIISIPASLFSYSTRCRERYIACYMSIFLKRLTPYSVTAVTTDKLGFWERTSVSIIITIILLNFTFLVFSLPDDFPSLGNEQKIWLIALFVIVFHIIILVKTWNLPTTKYKNDLEKKLRDFLKD